MSSRPEGQLAEALAECGVDPALVTEEYDDLCQEVVLTFLASHVAPQTLDALADLYLTFASRFEFATAELQDTFEQAVKAAPAMMKLSSETNQRRSVKLEALDLSILESVDAGSVSLGEFALRVEHVLGSQPGALLSVRDEKVIVVDPKRISDLRHSDLETVLALVERFAPNTQVVLIGRMVE